MKNIIIKTNKWYDNLSDGKRLFFFLFIIMSTMLFTQYLTISRKFFWAFPIWIIVFLYWRISYFYIDLKESYKKRAVQDIEETEEEVDNIEPLTFPEIQMWREVIWFSDDGQTDRIRKLHKYYKIIKTDDGYSLIKKK